jgi:hypothetical protein
VALPTIPVPRSLADLLTGATVAVETVEIFIAMSPGAPRGAADRGVDGADWSLFLAGLVLADSGTTGPDGKITVSLLPAMPYTLNVLGTNYAITLRADPLEALTDFTGQQRRLCALGYHLGDSGPDGNGVDGTMTLATNRAILEFQSDQGLKADGNVGPLTRGRLKVEVDDRPAPVAAGVGGP